MPIKKNKKPAKVLKKSRIPEDAEVIELTKERIEHGAQFAVNAFNRMSSKGAPMSPRASLMGGFYAGIVACGVCQECASEITDKYLRVMHETSNSCSCN